MAPEMAAFYIVGLVPSASVTGLQIWFHKKKVRGLGYRQLQENLKKVGLQWREAHSELEEYQPEKETHDLKRFERDILLMGAFFLFLSWIGAFFNALILISMHYLAISRKERKLFSTILTKEDLASEKIQEILKECQ